jgi:N,N'-diacetyllegionaminate synthase
VTVFRIGARTIGDGAPCFIIAEVGLAHDGSLGQAHAYVDAAADAGADAVKFQTHVASDESTPDEQFRVKVFPQDATRYHYWERTSFTEDQWRGLKEHVEARGMEFLSSVFSGAAVALLRRIGVKAWKIGSGETNNPLLLREVAAGREPVLISTGMSYWREIDSVVQSLVAQHVPVAVLQCTSRYPCPPQHLGLNLIAEYATRYGVPVGFSDHSGEVAAGLAAVTLGARIVEVHVTWHKQSFGPDVPASLTIERFADLVRGIRFLDVALERRADKDEAAADLGDMRTLFTKGLVATETIAAATPIELKHLGAKKPCQGIPAVEFDRVLGRAARRAIEKGSRITWDDLE